MPKVKFICEECNKEFEGWVCQNRRFCSNECGHKAHKKFLTGRWKNSKIIKCKECKKKFRVQNHRFKSGRGKYCSRECYGKAYSKKVTGKGNSQYIDGRTKKYTKAFYLSKEWRRLRKEIYERDNWICQNNKCKKKGGELHAHHKIPVGKCRDPFDKSNIITLCRKCHSLE